MSERDYMVAYTLFGVRYGNGFKTYYRHFDNYDDAKTFVQYHANIKDNYKIYQSIEKGDKVYE